MLSCFRTAVLRPSSVAHFSASALCSKQQGNFAELTGVLQDVAAQQQSTTPRKTVSKDSRPTELLWKPFQANRVVKPHDLTYKSRVVTPRSPTRRAAVGPAPAQARYKDVFYQFGIDPITQALNPAILSEYMSDMGKIYGRNITGLTFKSQRRIGKAIRRAKMMGIIPILSKPANRTQGAYSPKRS